MAELVLEDGFSASGSCYGGFVGYKGSNLWHRSFPGWICDKCCGGTELEIQIENFENRGVKVRAVQFGKLGKNDDLYTTQWFVKVPFVGWAHYGMSTYAIPSQMPDLQDD